MKLTKQETICLLLSLADRPLTTKEIGAGIIILDKMFVASEYSLSWLGVTE